MLTRICLVHRLVSVFGEAFCRAARFPITASSHLPEPAPLPRQGSTVSAMEEYISDCDLTTDDEEDEPEEAQNLPVADV